MKMDFFKNKFDLILSIGENCACTSYLRRCYLQSFSYPFDWLTHASFATRFDLLANNFENFLNFDDLYLTGKPVAENADKAPDYYANKYTDFYHWHDFPADIPLENSYDAVYEKYQRRIKRLYRMIGNSQKILFVWLSHSKQHGKDEICSEYRKLQDKFSGKEIFLLVIENDSAVSQEFLADGHIAVIHQDTSSRDKKHHYDPTMGNKTNNLKIFKKLKLKTSFAEKIKKIIYVTCKTVINLLPGRKLRQRATKKLNTILYHVKL